MYGMKNEIETEPNLKKAKTTKKKKKLPRNINYTSF